MSILIFIISLAILILVHELGHFLMAKSSGIRVDEFGIGLPPRIWGKKIGETIYSFNWIPFGGFVKIFGEDLDSQETLTDERSFQKKSKYKQALVLFAGVAFNFIFAWLIISLGFMIGLSAPVGYDNSNEIKNPQTVLMEVMPNSPAKIAGLKSGDVLLSVSTKEKTLSGKDISPENVSNLISKGSSGNIDILYKRGEKENFVSVTPNQKSDKRMIGVAMEVMGTIKLPIHKALFEGVKTTIYLTENIFIGLCGFIGRIFTFQADLSQVTGPVGIAGTFGEARELGFSFILSLVAMISINLALINLVPFPALDGGRLLFILIEIIIRKPISPKISQILNTTGFILLIILMFIVTWHDIFGV